MAGQLETPQKIPLAQVAAARDPSLDRWFPNSLGNTRAPHRPPLKEYRDPWQSGQEKVEIYSDRAI